MLVFSLGVCVRWTHNVNGDDLAGLASLQPLSVFVLNKVPVLSCLTVLERIYQMPDASRLFRPEPLRLHSLHSLFDSGVALAVGFP